MVSDLSSFIGLIVKDLLIELMKLTVNSINFGVARLGFLRSNQLGKKK